MDDNVDEEYLSKEKINEISDAVQGFELLADRDMVFNYVNNLDDIKEILFLKYHAKKENSEVIKSTELYSTYPQIMKDLGILLKSLTEYIELPEFKRELGEIHKISESQMETRVEKLDKMIKRDEFPILTAGEAKSGKSTFINLLLGKDLLPMDIVTCTRIICEIRNSNAKKVTFHGDGQISLTKDLPESPGKEIASIVKQEANVGYTKAVYEYPVNFLQNFTYLVDSPGIGDNDHLETMTFNYLNNYAPAFIFVLNATNSNGLNIKARQLIEKAKSDLSNDTCKFMTDLTSKSQANEQYFEYHKAIFILNHWDTVKENAKSKAEVDEVRKLIISEIKYLWHESVQENEQIFFISARQANEWQKSGIIQKEIINIRNCIKRLVVDLYQKNVENSLELLNLILNKMEKKILQKINTVVDNKYCRLYDKNHAEHLCQMLENLIKEMDNRKLKIREQLKPQLENMAVKLTEHLKSKDVENRILNISKSKITVTDNIELLTVVFRKTLETKLYDEIKLWEKENKEMEKLYSFLNGLFEENLIQISNEIKIDNLLINKESLIKAWNSTNQCEVTSVDKDFISKIEKAFIISTITLLFPVVALAGLLATPLIISHLFKERRFNEERLKAYTNDPEKYLRNMISNSLQKLSAGDVRKNFFKNVQKNCEDHITAFDTFITTEIKEKRQLITDIEKEKREIPEILKSLSNLFDTIENCYGDYHSLKNTCETVQDKCLIVRPTIYDKLYGNEKEITESLVTGKYSLIYKNKHYPDVVFKKYNKDFLKANARFQMQEISLLVKASCEYILRCKHICMRDKNKVMLVLENVDCNLHQYLFENNQLIPGRQEKNSDLWHRALKFILDIGIQLCQGLEYLHSYDPRMVHPDLRLDTVLVRKTDIPDLIKIFICDACTNLPTQRFHKKSGTGLLETPEDSFDMGGYTKENIYRLGDIFYKLAYFEIQNLTGLSSRDYKTYKLNDLNNTIESMESEVEIDWNQKKHSNLPDEYNKLVVECLSKKPENRPFVRHCIDILNSIKKNNINDKT